MSTDQMPEETIDRLQKQAVQMRTNQKTKEQIDILQKQAMQRAMQQAMNARYNYLNGLVNHVNYLTRKYKK